MIAPKKANFFRSWLTRPIYEFETMKQVILKRQYLMNAVLNPQHFGVCPALPFKHLSVYCLY